MEDLNVTVASALTQILNTMDTIATDTLTTTSCAMTTDTMTTTLRKLGQGKTSRSNSASGKISIDSIPAYIPPYCMVNRTVTMLKHSMPPPPLNTTFIIMYWIYS